MPQDIAVKALQGNTRALSDWLLRHSRQQEPPTYSADSPPPEIPKVYHEYANGSRTFDSQQFIDATNRDIRAQIDANTRDSYAFAIKHGYAGPYSRTHIRDFIDTTFTQYTREHLDNLGLHDWEPGWYKPGQLPNPRVTDNGRNTEEPFASSNWTEFAAANAAYGYFDESTSIHNAAVNEAEAQRALALEQYEKDVQAYAIASAAQGYLEQNAAIQHAAAIEQHAQGVHDHYTITGVLANTNLFGLTPGLGTADKDIALGGTFTITDPIEREHFDTRIRIAELQTHEGSIEDQIFALAGTTWTPETVAQINQLTSKQRALIGAIDTLRAEQRDLEGQLWTQWQQTQKPRSHEWRMGSTYLQSLKHEDFLLPLSVMSAMPGLDLIVDPYLATAGDGTWSKEEVGLTSASWLLNYLALPSRLTKPFSVIRAYGTTQAARLRPLTATSTSSTAVNLQHSLAALYNAAARSKPTLGMATIDGAGFPGLIYIPRRPRGRPTETPIKPAEPDTPTRPTPEPDPDIWFPDEPTPLDPNSPFIDPSKPGWDPTPKRPMEPDLPPPWRRDPNIDPEDPETWDTPEPDSVPYEPPAKPKEPETPEIPDAPREPSVHPDSPDSPGIPAWPYTPALPEIRPWPDTPEEPERPGEPEPDREPLREDPERSPEWTPWTQPEWDTPGEPQPGLEPLPAVEPKPGHVPHPGDVPHTHPGTTTPHTHPDTRTHPKPDIAPDIETGTPPGTRPDTDVDVEIDTTRPGTDKGADTDAETKIGIATAPDTHTDTLTDGLTDTQTDLELDTLTAPKLTTRITQKTTFDWPPPRPPGIPPGQPPREPIDEPPGRPPGLPPDEPPARPPGLPPGTPPENPPDDPPGRPPGRPPGAPTPPGPTSPRPPTRPRRALRKDDEDPTKRGLKTDVVTYVDKGVRHYHSLQTGRHWQQYTGEGGRPRTTHKVVTKRRGEPKEHVHDGVVITSARAYRVPTENPRARKPASGMRSAPPAPENIPKLNPDRKPRRSSSGSRRGASGGTSLEARTPSTSFSLRWKDILHRRR